MFYFYRSYNDNRVWMVDWLPDQFIVLDEPAFVRWLDYIAALEVMMRLQPNTLVHEEFD